MCIRDRFGDMVREPEILPSDLGSITISGPVNGMIMVIWDNADAVLQQSTNLTSDSWENVSGSQGTREMMFSVTGITENYFRLAAP